MIIKVNLNCAFTSSGIPFCDGGVGAVGTVHSSYTWKWIRTNVRRNLVGETDISERKIYSGGKIKRLKLLIILTIFKTHCARRSICYFYARLVQYSCDRWYLCVSCFLHWSFLTEAFNEMCLHFSCQRKSEKTVTIGMYMVHYVRLICLLITLVLHIYILWNAPRRHFICV